MLSRVEGQSEGVSYLRKIVEGRLTSPLLLVGQEGVGKRFSVIEAAKEAFAADDEDSPHTYQLNRGIHRDCLTVKSVDDREIGIDAIRELLQLSYGSPTSVTRRYVILDGADQLTNAAANALLKTLEEPPRFTQFFLLAKNADAVISTIRSRCLKIRYRPLQESFVLAKIQPLMSDPAKALVLARLSEGSLGRALQFFGSNRIELRDRVINLLKVCLSGDVSSLFAAVDSFKDDLKLGVHFLELLLRDLIMLPHDPTNLVNSDSVENLTQLRSRMGAARIADLLEDVRVFHRRETASESFQVKALLASNFVS